MSPADPRSERPAIRLALLGAGMMGATHAAGYRALGERVQLQTVVAHSQEEAAPLAHETGADAATDWEAVVADPQIDAVDICLPTPLHRPVAERALAAGKHVLVEKPIALTAADADAVLAAAQRSDRVLMVGMTLRFWPEYRELRRRVAAGEIGRPSCVRTVRVSPPVDWNAWMADLSQSGGVGIDLLVHDFDQMNALLGAPRRVYARAAHPDRMVAVVEYDDGEGVAEGSHALPRSHPFSSSIRVTGEQGILDYAFRAAPVAGESNIGGQDAEGALRLYPADGEARTIAVEPADPWGAQVAAFVGCVEGGREPQDGSGPQARAALLVALAANRSLASGRPEAVEA